MYLNRKRDRSTDIHDEVQRYGRGVDHQQAIHRGQHGGG